VEFVPWESVVEQTIRPSGGPPENPFVKYVGALPAFSDVHGGKCLDPDPGATKKLRNNEKRRSTTNVLSALLVQKESLAPDIARNLGQREKLREV